MSVRVGRANRLRHVRIDMSLTEKLAALASRVPWIAPESLKKCVERVAREEPDPVKARARIIRIATEVTEALAPAAACRQRCSHCCHQGLPVHEHEAVLLARVSGREMVRQPWRRAQEVDVDIDSSIGKPCPFLVDHACSVYEHRPLACRIRHSLSEDPDDCSLDGPTKGEFPALALEAAFIDTYVEVGCRTGSVEPVGSIHRYFPEPP